MPALHHQGNRLTPPFPSLLEEATRKYRNEYPDLDRGSAVTDGRMRAGLSGVECEISAAGERDGIFGMRIAFCVNFRTLMRI